MNGPKPGYKNPPREHQFKPGQSGNPKGRPRGSKSLATIIRALMRRKIEVRERGRTRQVEAREAMLLRFLENALKGDPKSAAFLLRLHDQVETSVPETGDNLSHSDQKILDDFAKSLLKKGGL